MNQTMSAIANATQQAKTALDNQTHFGMRTFGNGKYSVSLATNLNSENVAVVVYYRGTAVVQITKTEIKMQTYRYFTPTTKNVINAALFGIRSPFSVYQQDFQWYVHCQGEAWSTKTDLQFCDPMTLLLPTKHAALAVA